MLRSFAVLDDQRFMLGGDFSGKIVGWEILRFLGFF
jgi:hypothetical protein